MKNAYAYLRVSGQGQVGGDGFERQYEAIRLFARRNDYQLIQTFREEGVSGTTEETERPAFQAMMAEILRDGVQTVIVERLDRLARQYTIQEQIIVYLASKGVDLISADTGENITEAVMANDMKKAMIQMQATFAELEKNMLVKKLKAARDRKRREQGKCEGRKGYKDTEEGRMLRRKIGALRRTPKYGKGRTLAEIAQYLNENGIKTLTGKTWTADLVLKASN